MTKAMFINAIRFHAAVGGSTNAVLHLPAIADELDIALDLKLFDEINATTPYIASINPSSQQYTTNDLHFAGGVPAVLHSLLPLLNATCLTVTGKSIGEIAQQAQIQNSDVIHPLNAPIKPTGGLAVLYGNIAPEGAIVKISAVKNGLNHFLGKAKVFDANGASN